MRCFVGRGFLNSCSRRVSLNAGCAVLWEEFLSTRVLCEGFLLTQDAPFCEGFLLTQDALLCGKSFSQLVFCARGFSLRASHLKSMSLQMGRIPFEVHVASNGSYPTCLVSGRLSCQVSAMSARKSPKETRLLHASLALCEICNFSHAYP